MKFALNESQRDHLLLALTAVMVMLIGWKYWQDQEATVVRGGAARTRRVAPSAIRPLPLDPRMGRVTPTHLQDFFGPRWTPDHYTGHRCRWPATPGKELERLMYGAPGVYNTNTPTAERGWLFAPPAEMDF